MTSERHQMLAGLDSRNFAAPIRQILAGTQSGRQSRAFSHRLGRKQKFNVRHYPNSDEAHEIPEIWRASCAVSGWPRRGAYRNYRPGRKGRRPARVKRAVHDLRAGESRPGRLDGISPEKRTGNAGYRNAGTDLPAPAFMRLPASFPRKCSAGRPTCGPGHCQ